MPIRKAPAPPKAPEPEPPTPEHVQLMEEINEALGEVYKLIAIIAARLDKIESKIVGGSGAAVLAPTTGRHSTVTLVRTGKDKP